MSKNNKAKINSILKKFNSEKSLEAFKEIENLVQLDKTNIELIVSYGIMASKLNFNSKAINSFEYVLREQPTNLVCLHNLYVIFLKKNFLDKALDLI